MVTSQSAAIVATQAIDEDAPVQQVKQAKLSARLLEDGQVLYVRRSAASQQQKMS
jgi:hypothetical protein